MKDKGIHIIFSIGICILTIALVVQIRSIFFAPDGETSVLDKTKEDLLSAQNYNAELLRIKTELQAAYDARIQALGDNEIEIRIKELNEQLKQIQQIVGLTTVSGHGVILSISDRDKNAVDINEQAPSEVLVHSYQVYQLINELKKAGAQAISINGERILASSEIFCTGGSIKINGNRYVPPYVIKAIGNPDVLSGYVTTSDIYNELMSRKLKFSLVKENHITVEYYKGSVPKKTNLLTEAKEENQNEQQ